MPTNAADEGFSFEKKSMRLFNVQHKAADAEQVLISRLRDPGTRRQAFAEVVERYGQQLYWQIRKMVTFHDDADDVLQNTFVKAWTNLDGFRAEAKLSTWLFAIAYHESITFLTRQKEHVSLDNALSATDGDEDDSSATFADMLTADDYFDGDEAQALLQQAIHTLPPKQQAVFCMKYFDEMKYDDMSVVTGTSVGALKASYHLAVKKIEDFIRSKEMD